jgi:hypothetical protein
VSVSARQIWVDSLNKTLQKAIDDGQIGGATATDYTVGTNAQMETAAATAPDGQRWYNTDHNIEYMFVKKRWSPFGLPDARFGFVRSDEFDSNAVGFQLAWTATGTVGNGSGETAHPGIATIRTTAASTRASLSLRSTAFNLGGSAEVNFDFAFRFVTLSTATEDYVATFGLNDNNAFDSNGHAIDGVYFSYNRAVNGNNLQLVTSSNNTRTTTNTSQALVANTWYYVWCKIKSNTSAEFFIWNGTTWTSLGTHTTNIPTGAGRETGFQVKIDRVATAGSTSLGMDLDLFYNWDAFGTSK